MTVAAPRASWHCHECGAGIPGRSAQHCTACHQTFASTHSGDRHRTGKHGVTTGPDRRRCLTPEEMQAVGMRRNRQGVWVTLPDYRWEDQ